MKHLMLPGLLALGLVGCGGSSSGGSSSTSDTGTGTGTNTGTETVLYSFMGTTDGLVPEAGLIQGSDGNFYGTTAEGGSVFKITPEGALTALHLFTGTSGDGLDPVAGLVQGSNGNFYGTTLEGGTYTETPNASEQNADGLGTLYMITPGGTETVLYSFGGYNGDAYTPVAGLIQGTDGNFYGTASGGANGDGAVFKFDPTTLTETVLYSFAGGTADGSTPVASLIQASDGNFYGMTEAGGANDFGTIFEITPAGVETVLYSFKGQGSGDGEYPVSALIQGTNGNFYGTTYAGGAGNSSCASALGTGTGCGTIFEYSPGSATETVLASFGATAATGINPNGLILGQDGNLYGTTTGGGTASCSISYGCGILFEFSLSSGTETVLHNFASFSGDGANPYAPVIQGTNGDFYGTTASGGADSYGTVYEYAP